MAEIPHYNSEAVARWKTGIEQGQPLDLEARGVVGIPTDPVVAIPFVDDAPPVARVYEARTFANGGAVIVQHQGAAEAALNAVLRPGTDLIEVGHDPQRDLVTGVTQNSGTVRVNGHLHEDISMDAMMTSIARKKGIRRVVAHQQDHRIAQLAGRWGLDCRENVDMFQHHSTKTGLNHALRDYKTANPHSPLGPLGVPIDSAEAAIAEHRRLAMFGASAIVKFDYSSEGLVRAGTTDPLVLGADLKDTEAYEQFIDYCRREGITNPSCEMQMLIKPHAVISVSSGQVGDRILPFETHIQTQKNGAADGAKPLRDNPYAAELFDRSWPAMADFYRSIGITGNQNMNFLVMPPEFQRLAQEVYGDPHMSGVLPIDLNYRPISGFLNAASRYREDTGQILDMQNFFSRSVAVAPEYAANPHALFIQAQRVGLNAGQGGNFTLVNASKFEPRAMAQGDMVSAQIIVSGDTLVGRPVDSLQALEEVLKEPSSLDDLRGRVDMVRPGDVQSMDEIAYRAWLTQQLRSVII